MATATDHLWSVDQAAEYNGVSPLTIRRLIWDGKLKARKVGRAIRIDPRDAMNVGVPIKTYSPSSEAGDDVA